MKRESIKWGFFVVILFSFLIAVAGCGDSNLVEWLADDDSYEAQLEAARMALDDSDYDEAIAILEDMEQTDEVIQYLSNAYAGLAGLDTFTLLETISDLEDSDDSGGIDMVGLVLGDDDGTLTSDEVDDKLDDLDDAIAALESIENLTDDQEIQLGLLAVNHLALTIATLVMDDTGETDIELTEDGLGDLYDDTDADLSATTTDELDELMDDLEHISNSIDAISELTGNDTADNDLSESFNEFAEDVSETDTNGEQTITVESLEAYLNSL